MKLPKYKKLSLYLKDRYADDTLDPKEVLADVETLEKYQRFYLHSRYSIAQYQSYYLRSRCSDAQHLEANSKRAFEEYLTKYASDLENQLRNMEFLRRVTVATKVSDLSGDLVKLHTISGKGKWKKERKVLVPELIELADRMYEAHKNFDNEEIDLLYAQYLKAYWERLKVGMAEKYHGYYAAAEVVIDEKENPSESVSGRLELLGKGHRGFERETCYADRKYPELQPAKGVLYVFDTEDERNAYVAEQASPHVIPVELDDLTDLQWVVTEAIRYAPPQPWVKRYAALENGELFAVYETRDQTEQVIEKYPYRKIEILEIPYYQS